MGAGGGEDSGKSLTIADWGFRIADWGFIWRRNDLNSDFGMRKSEKKEKQKCGLRPVGAYAPEGSRKKEWIHFKYFFLTGFTGLTGFFHGFHLLAIANRSGEAGGNRVHKISN